MRSFKKALSLCIVLVLVTTLSTGCLLIKPAHWNRPESSAISWEDRDSSSRPESSQTSWGREESSESSWTREESSESSVTVQESELSETSSTEPSSESSESSSQTQESSSHSQETSTSVTEERKKPNLGTAGEIGGRTVLVAIFVNNTRYSWDFNDPTDLETYSHLYYRLKTAAEWIEDQAAAWGTQTEIIWDWYNNPDLYYVADFNSPLDGPTSSRYREVYGWLVENVDANALLDEYQADNILFFWYVDTTLDEEENSFAFQFDFSYLTDSQVGYEGMWFNVRHDGFEMGAPTLAHEMLHCFGAVDLYYTNEWITQEYMDYLRSSGSEDIMYMVHDSPDEILEYFSELDAYYVGLTDYSYDVERFGLGMSPHLRDPIPD